VVGITIGLDNQIRRALESEPVKELCQQIYMIPVIGIVVDYLQEIGASRTIIVAKALSADE
jgi:hypothetical protein